MCLIDVENEELVEVAKLGIDTKCHGHAHVSCDNPASRTTIEDRPMVGMVGMEGVHI